MDEIFRLLTFNIAHGRGLSFYQGFSSEIKIRRNVTRIARLLRNSGASMVALQEVDEDSHWNRNLNLLRMIQEEAGYPYAEIGIHNRREGDRPLAYGNALLSKYPVHQWDNNPFGQATLGEKGFLYAVVDVGGHALPVINLHLDYRSRKRRIEQVEQIIAYICERPHPGRETPLVPIICGDFNSGSRRVDDAVSHLFRFVQNHGDYRLYPEGARTFPRPLSQPGDRFHPLARTLPARSLRSPEVLPVGSPPGRAGVQPGCITGVRVGAPLRCF